MTSITTVTTIKIFRLDNGKLSRSYDRIEQHLKSIRLQKGDLEILPIISDMSEDEEVVRSIKKICKKYDAYYINTKSNLIFNKSFGLNIGILNSKNTKYLATIDADIILREDTLLKCVESKNNKNVVLCRTFMLNDYEYNGEFDKESFSNLKGLGSFLNKGGNGGIQFFERSWLFKVRGYDERYNLRGGMDNEIIKRCLLDGLSEKWINDDDQIYLAHINHDRFNFKNISQSYVKNYREHNVKIYNKLRSIRVSKYKPLDAIIVNKKSWGKEEEVVGPRFINGKVVS